MRRIACLAVFLFVAVSLFAHDGPNRKAKSLFIATTGRIVAIDYGARSITVSGSDGPAFLQLKTPSIANRLEEFTVITTNETLFQDGADPIRFEDFKTGEAISIHGWLKRTMLTASRIAKWD